MWDPLDKDQTDCLVASISEVATVVEDPAMKVRMERLEGGGSHGVCAVMSRRNRLKRALRLLTFTGCSSSYLRFFCPNSAAIA